MSRPNDAAVVLNADEHDSSMTVRETHDGVHEIVVSERYVRLGDELSGELLAGCNEAAKLDVGEQNDWRCRRAEDSRVRTASRDAALAVGVASYQTTECGQALLLTRRNDDSVFDHRLACKHSFDVIEWIAIEDDELRFPPGFDYAVL